MNTDLNASIRDIPMPQRMGRLPIDDRGFPVPWFVAEIDGKWDFRAIGPGKIFEAYNRRLCWLCGHPMGRYLAFVIGPMCSVTRVTSEPPSHLECATYAAKACPFLANPRMRRNEVNLPGGTVAGDHIPHNPGATAIWITKTYSPFPVDDGTLFKLGDPVNVLWYHEGRPASRAEVQVAINKGFPILHRVAAMEGRESIAVLETCLKRALPWLPKQEADNARSV